MFNSHVVLDNKGEIKCINDKIHLFESNIKHGESYVTLKESDYTEPGSQFHLPLDSPIGLLATPICYDLRFPILSSLMRKLGAQIITYPSVFTELTGEAHWEVLLRARAIENQCYVVAAAQVGKHNEKRSSFGYSMIVDPWGKIIANCEKESPSYKLAEINLNYLNEVRNSIPILNSHRNDLYIQMPIVIKKIDREFYFFSDKIKLSNSVIFLETLHCIAFVNIKPIVKGHVMVIPKQIRTRVEEMTSEESIDLFNTARLVSARLEKHLDASSLNFGIQDGPDSGQSVKHVHLHILPRRKGDMERNDEIYEKLQSHDKDMTTGLRTPEEMAAEASEFRKLFY
jgi:diadenosine tetraphosphate (Ap4A) HIT family hydrolase